MIGGREKRRKREEKETFSLLDVLTTFDDRHFLGHLDYSAPYLRRLRVSIPKLPSSSIWQPQRNCSISITKLKDELCRVHPPASPASSQFTNSSPHQLHQRSPPRRNPNRKDRDYRGPQDLFVPPSSAFTTIASTEAASLRKMSRSPKKERTTPRRRWCTSQTCLVSSGTRWYVFSFSHLLLVQVLC